MSNFTRRGFLVSAGSVATLTAACGNGVGNNGAATIDARVDATQAYLHSTYPGTDELKRKAVGILYFPLITEAGFGIGGAYGRGALRINGTTVDYYSAVRGTIGFQIGGQQYAHVIYFMTEQALSDFRSSSGWAMGADARYAVSNKGGSLGIDTTTEMAPVVALVFGQAGLIAGATLGGTKYTRILP
ncbi:hypothetical protein GALL_459100 [mine drainage metagenome]|uniref:Ysc84 actin-binding domain-containing protein n=1 Tax=mine drainage metagenome TaxID=410659 RepID=A0A1J5PNU5_9ZZZZ